MTDKTKPISSSNPPESKRQDRVQDAPLSPDIVLQNDERELDVDQKEKEEKVAEVTGSKAKRTKVTDK